MKQLLIIFFTIFFSNILLSNCEIGKPTVEILPCDANGNFNVLLSFDYAMAGNEGFKVQGNGKFYGPFQYGSLPVTIGPFTGNGTSTYELVVKDLVNPDCSNFVEFAAPQCNNCEIWDLVVDTLECVGAGKYAIKIDFNYQDPASDYFFVYQNGVKLGKYLYSSLPLVLNNISDSGKNWDVLKVVDSENEDCFDVVEFPVMDCGSGGEDCNLSNLTATVSDCDSLGKFTVTIDFDFVNTGSEGFSVFGNGIVYGMFDYGQLPITIGPLMGSSEKEWEFIVKDKEYNECNIFTDLGIIDCIDSCFTYKVNIDPLECVSDSSYALKLNFKTEDAPDSTFTVVGNGVLFGTYKLKNLPLLINTFPGTGSKFDTLTICLGTGSGDCCHSYIFEGFECQNQGDCKIYELSVTKGDCASDSTYSLTVNFLHQNTQSNQFDLKANGIYFGTYLYSQLPLTISNFPKSGGNVDWIKVCDHEEENCCKEKEFETQACGSGDCKLYDLVVETLDCITDSSYNAVIDFEHQNTIGGGFDVIHNGKFIGYYLYSQLPLTLVGLVKSGNKNDYIKVFDNDNESCFAIKEFLSPNCGGDCKLYDLSVKFLECITDSSYNVILDFEHENTIGNGFDLFHNGKFIGYYLYSQLPLTLVGLVKSGNTNDYIKVRDNDNEGCFAIKEYKSPECGMGDCKLYELSIDILECTSDSTYNAVINFLHDNTTSNGFKLIANGKFIGTFLYSQLPLTVNGLLKSGNKNDYIKVFDKENEMCFKIKEYESPKCENMANCQISDLSATVQNCVGNKFDVLINFDHSSDSDAGFSITGNGKNYGNYLYSSVPVKLKGLEANNTEYEFVITDLIFADCQKETFIGKVDCSAVSTSETKETFLLVSTDLNHWRIKTNIQERIDYSIYQIDGKMIISNTLGNDQLIDLNAHAAGTYILVLKSGSNFQSFKLIKR